MVFSSNIFLFLFLPVFLGIYYLAPKRFRSLAILIGSYAFYAWWRVDFLALFVGVTLWNYMFGRALSQSPGRARLWLAAGVGGDLLTLAVFKYFNFGIETLNTVLDESGLHTVHALRFILPIGISFYIFQSISFLIDVYRKDAPAPKSFIDFAAFIALFPQLIAGPILRYKDIAPQFEHREHSLALFSQGAYRFMLGFTKKILIADTVATLVDPAFSLPNPSTTDAWMGALAYTVQLYYDFSGYSDMAIGLGLMMGFHFMENFNAPYTSRSITEFWRRWHISLSTWLKDYLYIPLGGNRRGRVRTYINLMVTMILGGLWHGANWTFVLWGAWHGFLLALERVAGIRSLGTLLTLILVVLGWVMFRAASVPEAMTFYAAMAGTGYFGLSASLRWQVSGMALSALAAGFALIFLVPAVEKWCGKSLVVAPSVPMQGAVILLFLLSVLKLTAQNYSPFLYFQF